MSFSSLWELHINYFKLLQIHFYLQLSESKPHKLFWSVLFSPSQNLSSIILLPTQHTANCHQRQDPYESCIGFLVHYTQTQKKKLLSNHKSCTIQIALYTYATQGQHYIVLNYHTIPFLIPAKRLCLRSNKVLCESNISQSFQSFASFSLF